MNIEGLKYKLKIENGIISELYSDVFGFSTNLSLKGGKCGSACFTYSDDDIKSGERELFTPYNDRQSVCDVTEMIDSCTVRTKDTKNGIITEFKLDDNGIIIDSFSENEGLSEFGINLEMNFSGRKGSRFNKQLLPTSPYKSSDGRYMYYIMTNPEGKFLVVTALTECDGWKIDYSPECAGHYILNVKILSSFDRAYGGTGRKHLKINICAAQSIDEVFEIVSRLYHAPICRPILNGGFEKQGIVKVYGEYDCLTVTAPSGRTYNTEHENIELEEFGFYSVKPVIGDTAGADCVLWNGNSILEMFNKSCDAIKKPYHNDDNLCEGGCFLWAMLVNMQFNNNLKYDEIAAEELEIIMAKKELVPHKTIVPYPINDRESYHMYKSDRVQEQFFGVSILLEAYKLYNNREFYEYMVLTLTDLIKNYIKNGMIYNGTDYTTVCAPIITIIDAARLMREEKDEKYAYVKNAADAVSEFLYKRQYNFPTEGEINDKYDTEYEDGSISCTALSLLYYCRFIKRNAEYEKFAFDVLKLHEAWTIYSPDARMNNSSFRWWETIWEGDGEGPAICCGHAWTIWKGEALFHGGILSRDDRMLLESWNAYVTNFCKTQSNGTMYACYEADYIRGGGHEETKKGLKQLEGENTDIKYEIAHSFPKHVDNSLSRYAWVRAYYTWLKTAAVLRIDGKLVAINAKIDGNLIKTDDNITQIYIGCENLEIENKSIKSL